MNIQVYKSDYYKAKVRKAILVSPSYLKVKLTHKTASQLKVYGIDMRHFKAGIAYEDWDNPMTALLSQISPKGDATLLTFGWDSEHRAEGITQFPYYFCLAKGEQKTDMDVDVEYFAPAPETDVEFYQRLMPFLHDAAKAFSEQHTPHIAQLTGNSRNPLYQVRHTDSKNRMESTTLGFQLPIGFAARELDSHRQGNVGNITRQAVEKLVRDIHEVFIKPDAWWEHHYGHDVKYWNKYHNARQILLTTPEGKVESIYDIDANIRKNLPKIDRNNEKIVAQQGEAEFHELATTWFSKALYGPREPIKKRKLTFEEKT